MIKKEIISLGEPMEQRGRVILMDPEWEGNLLSEKPPKFFISCVESSAGAEGSGKGTIYKCCTVVSRAGDQELINEISS